MEIALLSEYPHHASQIARWYYDQWLATTHHSLETVMATINTKVHQDSPGAMVVAREGETLVGVAELKEREMARFPQFTHWLGGVYVEQRWRRQGIASALVTNIMHRAVSHDIRTLYLQTEDLSGGLYNRHGFLPMEELLYKGRRVLVMAAQLRSG